MPAVGQDNLWEDRDMNTKSVFTHPPSPPLSHPVYRYGMLVFILCLLGRYVLWYLGLPAEYPYDRYGTGILELALLFNHLAFSLEWRPLVTAALRVLAVSWIVFTFFYLIYFGG
jgi:hypothetical protein